MVTEKKLIASRRKEANRLIGNLKKRRSKLIASRKKEEKKIVSKIKIRRRALNR